MAYQPNEAAVAHHLIMALLSDLAMHDDPRLVRMEGILDQIRANNPGWSQQDVADLDFAKQTIEGLRGKRQAFDE